MEHLIDQLKALADGTRLRIFKLVQDRELCVCQVVEAMDIAQPTVSAHLAKLRRAGLVSQRREGQWSYYVGNPEGIRSFEKALRQFLAASPEELPDIRDLAARAEAAGRAATCRRSERDERDQSG